MRKLNVHEHLWDIEDNTVELLLRKMDEHEVEITCVTIGSRHLWQDYDCNDFVEAAFKEHSDRLRGFGWVNLGVDTARKVRELKDRGFAGLKFIYPRVAYNDERLFDVYTEAERLKMPCVFHLGPVLAKGKKPRFQIDSNRMRAGTLDLIARECPELRIVGAHLGWADHNEAWAFARQHPHLYLDTSGNGYLRRQPREFFAYSILGWERTLPKLVFGTDQYYRGWDDEIATTERLLDEVWQVDAQTKARIYYDNLADILSWAGVL